MKMKWLVLDAAFLVLMAGVMLSLRSGPSTNRPQSVVPATRPRPPIEQIEVPVIEIPEPALPVKAQPVPPTAEATSSSQQDRPLLAPYNLPGLPVLWRVK